MLETRRDIAQLELVELAELPVEFMGAAEALPVFRYGCGKVRSTFARLNFLHCIIIVLVGALAKSLNIGSVGFALHLAVWHVIEIR